MSKSEAIQMAEDAELDLVLSFFLLNLLSFSYNMEFGIQVV